jgi:DNA-binding transcriptional ArsR family regulator
MKSGPDIARIAAVIGEPARANMLSALMSGMALTARELADEAGVRPSTASSHLDALRAAKLIALEKQGRHRYFRIANEEVARLIETLAVVSEDAGHRRVRTGPKEPALRKARCCYNHLAGEMGVRAFDSMCARGFFTLDRGQLSPTNGGRRFLAALGLEPEAFRAAGRDLCRSCLDWSERRHHLAGRLGTALLAHILKSKWATRDTDTRILRFTPAGERKFNDAFPF